MYIFQYICGFSSSPSGTHLTSSCSAYHAAQQVGWSWACISVRVQNIKTLIERLMFNFDDGWLEELPDSHQSATPATNITVKLEKTFASFQLELHIVLGIS